MTTYDDDRVRLTIWIEYPVRALVRARAKEAKQSVSEWVGNALRVAVLNESLAALRFPTVPTMTAEQRRHADAVKIEQAAWVTFAEARHAAILDFEIELGVAAALAELTEASAAATDTSARITAQANVDTIRARAEAAADLTTAKHRAAWLNARVLASRT